MKSQSDHLKQLGDKSEIPTGPDAAILEVIPCDLTNGIATCAVRFTIPEFTSLCPKTGQPDFAIIVIDYGPKKLLVESKALKLFMSSFRNHGAFHEDVSAYIGKRLASLLDPYWLRVAAFWYPRGGIPIDVLWEYGSQTVQLFPENGIPHENGIWSQLFIKALPLPEYPFRGR